jgi:hypothetical protein
VIFPNQPVIIMKTCIRHIIAVLLTALFITAPIVVIAQDAAAPAAETATAIAAAEALPPKALDILTVVATWYGAICVAVLLPLTSLLLTGCNSLSSATEKRILYQPPIMNFKAGQTVQTADGLYTP